MQLLRSSLAAVLAVVVVVVVVVLAVVVVVVAVVVGEVISNDTLVNTLCARMGVPACVCSQSGIYFFLKLSRGTHCYTTPINLAAKTHHFRCAHSSYGLYI